MANLQDLRRRIKSVRNMQKTTKAMKMVASAKLRRAQERVRAARPYADTMARVLGRLAARAGDYHHPLLDERGDQHYLLVLVTSDKGLCGGVYTNPHKNTYAVRLNKQKQKNKPITGGGRAARRLPQKEAAH